MLQGKDYLQHIKDCSLQIYGQLLLALRSAWRCYLPSGATRCSPRAEEEETGDAAPGSSAAPGGDGYRPVLPSIIMGNVRSLPNKMDELAALTRHQREYRECSLLLFTETWLTALTPDTAAELDGFTPPPTEDRRSKESGKRKGGGLAVFVK
ncbi:hypothetical protein L3Q82_005895 [Scortum barcoo]|uniref:Uncharacterized protein n=1 Tax=Scortum barcoo TaxID=214431 RepID=A0ACB8V8V6_9TELE|nr:hypothetical protein L3Q82_005895 [Scortum barcoo]